MSRGSKRKAKVVHIEYFRAYNEVLKHDEVIDINIDLIFQTYLRVIADLRSKKDLISGPTQTDIDLVKGLLLDRLSSSPDYRP